MYEILDRRKLYLIILLFFVGTPVTTGRRCRTQRSSGHVARTLLVAGRV